RGGRVVGRLGPHPGRRVAEVVAPVANPPIAPLPPLPPPGVLDLPGPPGVVPADEQDRVVAALELAGLAVHAPAVLPQRRSSLTADVRGPVSHEGLLELSDRGGLPRRGDVPPGDSAEEGAHLARRAGRAPERVVRLPGGPSAEEVAEHQGGVAAPA